MSRRGGHRSMWHSTKCFTASKLIAPRAIALRTAAADRPFIAALAISSKARGTSHKPYTLLTAFDHPHILIGKSEMVTNFMHQNMSNNRIQRDLTSSPKTEDRIDREKSYWASVRETDSLP